MKTSKISYIGIILFTFLGICSTSLYSQNYFYKDKLFETEFSFEPHPTLVSVKYLSNLDSVTTRSKSELLAPGFTIKEDLIDKFGYLLLESNNPDSDFFFGEFLLCWDLISYQDELDFGFVIHNSMVVGI